MSKSRYDDVLNAGRSKLVPYKQGEKAKDRHRRRFEVAIKLRDSVELWANAVGIGLTIANSGHHWIFNSDGRIAEWWPSTAKLVFDRNYIGGGIHVHDVAQLTAVITDRWSIGV